jgi:hypothetical protein
LCGEILGKTRKNRGRIAEDRRNCRLKANQTSPLTLKTSSFNLSSAPISISNQLLLKMCCYFHFFSYFSLPISPIDQTETFTNAPSTDLKPYVLEVFVYLMRAQARECILKRLQMENSRDYETLLIESQCLMNEYNKIHYDIQTNSINFPACWEGLIPLKTEYYKALSHVYFAKKIAQKNEIAEEKNRLKTIQAHLQTAQSSHEEILRLQRMCRELRVSLMSFLIEFADGRARWGK